MSHDVDRAGRQGDQAAHERARCRAVHPADVVELARWTAEYYAAGARRGDHRGAAAQDTRRARRLAQDDAQSSSLTAAGMDVQTAKVEPPRQREALEMLAGAPRAWPSAELAAARRGRRPRHRLPKAGLVSVRQERVDRDPFESSSLEARSRWTPSGASRSSRTPR